MRFLLDSNVLIPAEPTSSRDVEPTTPAIVQLLALLGKAGHQATVHPASAAEIRADRNVERSQLRSMLLGRYPLLEHAPGQSSRLIAELGTPRAGSHDEVDLLLLSAVEANAVDYLVTEDDGIHRRARRLGLEDRVLTIADATITVGALFPTIPAAPPLVRPLVAHQLNETDPIFASFRSDYPEFDDWLSKCKREHRQCWVVQGAARYAGICIVKEESHNDYALRGKTLKLCTFKIADEFRGYRYGELLLKTLFSYLVKNGYERVFVEVLPKQANLFALLEDFGFEDVGESSKGERVLAKAMLPESGDVRVGPLEFNVKYGPHAVSLVGAQVFLVPIRPKYHQLLFPEVEQQLALPTESHPFGNSIRKAYLSNSRIKKIGAGDLLLFYRSEQNQGITSVGVVEGTLSSIDAAELARFVSRRTVYSFAEILEMSQKPTLAVLFRLARVLDRRWDVDLLKRTGIMSRAPQSFMQVAGEGVEWIASQLNVPH